MALTKPAGAWTYEDLFALPDDGKRYEIIEGDALRDAGAHKRRTPSVDCQHRDHAHPAVSGLGGRWYTAPLMSSFQGAESGAT